jgi:hypothetical protein
MKSTLDADAGNKMGDRSERYGVHNDPLSSTWGREASGRLPAAGMSGTGASRHAGCFMKSA